MNWRNKKNHAQFVNNSICNKNHSNIFCDNSFSVRQSTIGKLGNK
jgi:hypothetical protein